MNVASPDVETLVKAHAEARTQAEAGDLTGARTSIEDALAIGEVRLGHAHPRLAPLMVDLATIARNLGNLTEARAQLRRAYAIIVAASGPEHATALSVEGRLAAVTYRLGEPTEAYDWHLADVGARILGNEHPAVRGAQERLASRPQQPDSMPSHYVPSAESPGVYERVEPEAVSPPPYLPMQPQTDENYQSVPYQSQPYEASGIYAVEPAEGEYDDDPDVWREPQVQAPRRRGHGGGVAVVASLGVAILIAAAVVAAQLFFPGQSSQPPAVAPTGQIAATAPVTVTAAAPISPAPTNVTIQDNGGSVTLTWVDPSGGKVPFIVTGGREGSTSTPLETVPAGRTTSTIYGLNVHFNYCYTVTAVWSSELITPSIRTCTRRVTTSGTP